MTTALSTVERFNFSARPVPVPGDLRINWRISIILLMLGDSRSKRASLAKLHLLNNALRSGRARSELDRLLSHARDISSWQMRIEPAFGRAIDFVVGEQLASWTRSSQRAALQLTKKGIHAWEALRKFEDTLILEKEFLSSVGKRITEDLVSSVLKTKRSNP